MVEKTATKEGYFKPSQARLGKLIQQAIVTRCALCDCFCNEAVCKRCQSELPLNQACCQRCANPLPSDDGYDLKSDTTANRLDTDPNHQPLCGPLCGQCLVQLPPYVQAFCPYVYSGGVRELVHQLKFSAHLGLARFVSQKLLQHLREGIPKADFPELIVPIPLHPQRLKQRGYNQAQLLAKALASELGLPYDAKALRRKRPTPSQSGLSTAQRLANVKNVFKADVCRLAEVQNILLIDDVMTTGATIQAAVREFLKVAPNARVWVVAIARTQRGQT